MIVTVTMNPALDKTAQVPQLIPGALNRLTNIRVDAGGKGVNVSKMAAVLGGKTVCTGFVGGKSGQELCDRLDKLGLPNDFLVVEGTTRTNLKVVDAQSGLTELNEPGICVTPKDLDTLLKKTISLAGAGGIVVLSGSLPQGADTNTYCTFTTRLREAGCTVVVDADGEAFRKALQAPPHVIKPNRFELMQYYNLPENTPDDQIPDLCAPLLNKGISWVVVSMGAEGAMFFTPQHQARAEVLPVKVSSTVGAGDSMVGAIVYAMQAGLNFEETVRLAMAASIGAVTTPGTNPPTLELVKQLQSQIKIQPIK